MRSRSAFLAFALLSACSSNETNNAATNAIDGAIDSTADARTSSEASDAGSDSAETPSETALDIATWNLKTFPVAVNTPARVAEIVKSLNLDLIVFQEIMNPEAFAQLDEQIADMAAIVLTPEGAGEGTEYPALLYKPSLLHVDNAKLAFVGDSSFPRPVLTAHVSIASGPKANSAFDIVVVHLKAGKNADDEQKRFAASTKIEQTIAAQLASSPANILVLGDFNEAFGDPRADEIFGIWRSHSDRYHLLTDVFRDGGVSTFLPAQIVLDHMITTVHFDEELGAASPIVPPVSSGDGTYQAEVSDHLPLVLRLTL